MTPENLRRWIMSPQVLKPGASMPDLGLSDQEAQDVAAFLYSQAHTAAD
jgi:cytochrome c1